MESKLIGNRVYITDKESIFHDEWGVIAFFDGECYHIKIANGSDVLPMFNRDQFMVPGQGKNSPRNTGNESPITRQRMASGITQAQLAEAVGVKPQHIGRWERGERKPKMDALLKIAEALGCGINDLI